MNAPKASSKSNTDTTSATHPRSILVVNLYYPPDTASTGHLLHEMCVELVESGATVHVLTGQPSYTESSDRAPEFEILDGVHVHRISRRGRAGRSSILRRIRRYASFTIKAWFLSVKIARSEHIDSVVTVSNPPTVGMIGRRVAKKLNIPFSYILFDIHPDAVQLSNRLRTPPGTMAIWRWMNRRIWNSASNIIVPGRYMANHLSQAHSVPTEKISVLPLWATPELSKQNADLASSNRVRKQFGLENDSLLILHAGNIGLMHRTNDLIDAVGSVEHLNVEMAVTGGGFAADSAKAHLREKSFTNIKFLGFVEDDDFSHLLQSANIAATTLIPEMEKLSMPSRTLTFLSAGLPVLTIMAPKSDIGDLINETGCGWLADSSSMASEILTNLASDPEMIKIASQKASATYSSRFTKKLGTRHYAEAINDQQT